MPKLTNPVEEFLYRRIQWLSRMIGLISMYYTYTVNASGPLGEFMLRALPKILPAITKKIFYRVGLGMISGGVFLTYSLIVDRNYGLPVRSVYR